MHGNLDRKFDENIGCNINRAHFAMANMHENDGNEIVHTRFDKNIGCDMGTGHRSITICGNDVDEVMDKGSM